MRLTAALAPLLVTSAIAGGTIPSWALLTVISVNAALTALQVVVTQLIRLRPSSRIPRSQDAVRVLEIERAGHPAPRARHE